MIEDSLLGLSAAGFHRMAYTDWGDPAAEQVVICVHGLTRNGRDFDRLAEVLADDGCRVICPDVVGRGRSDWLKDPQGYQIGFYAADMLVLMNQLQASTLDWVGTSMPISPPMLVPTQSSVVGRRCVSKTSMSAA